MTRSGTSDRLGRSAPAVEELGLVQVVGPTPKLDVADGGMAPDAVRVEMVELREGPFVAAPASHAPEGTAAVIPEPDGAADLRGNLP